MCMSNDGYSRPAACVCSWLLLLFPRSCSESDADLHTKVGIACQCACPTCKHG